VAVNPGNIGTHENMNRVLELSSGTLFRWISADDWLEPRALSEAVRALEEHPEAVGVTSDFTLHTPGRTPRQELYPGEFPTGSDAARRFACMLWFFHAGDAIYDPVYGVWRREQLLRTGRIRPSERTDWLLSAELALMGPILHLHEPLAHRTNDYPLGIDRAAFRRRLDPVRAEQLKASPTRMYRDLTALARAADLSEAQRRDCRSALRHFWLREVKRTGRRNLADAAHRTVPGLLRWRRARRVSAT
jgi:hypothetical protein